MGRRIYSEHVAIGDDKLIWNARGGFFRFYFYHTLRNMNYGTVENTPDALNSFPKDLSTIRKNKCDENLYQS